MSIIRSVCIARHRYWIVGFEIRSGRRWNNVTIHRGEICVACILDPTVRSTCPRMSISDPCPHFPWYAQVPIALYGFVIAATWIDFIADHLVALLEFLGIVARIPNYIMGLTVSDEFLLKISGTYFISFFSYFLCAEYSTQSRTCCCFLNTYKVLAWGNSMPDLSGNVTMARKGLANMAITACFAGPVFNILVGLGCGFGVLRHATGNENHYVHLTPAIRTGFVFCFVNCGLLLVTGLAINKGKIPSGYGYSAIALYTAYIGTSLLLQFLL